MSASDRIGQQLSHYRLLRLLEQGHLSDVYLADHMFLDQQVAVKVWQTQLATSDSSKALLEEARYRAVLQHPHILPILEYGIVGNEVYIIMPYASGGSLRQRHPRGTQVPLPVIISYVKQIAEGLQYAHEFHIIHCNIKPENILFGPAGQLMLSDFGLALLTHSSAMLGEQRMADTLPYTAPEQLSAHPNFASDQYALAVMVYEWLTGECPFRGSSLEIAMQHLHQPPPSLREKLPTIPELVEQVVFRALAKDSQQRYPSIKEFANSLERASQATVDRLPFGIVEGQNEQLVPNIPDVSSTPKRANQATIDHLPSASESPRKAKQNYLLRQAREEQGLSQSEVAEAIGVDVRSYRRWENEGQIPGAYTQTQLARYFGKTTLDELGFAKRTLSIPKVPPISLRIRSAFHTAIGKVLLTFGFNKEALRYYERAIFLASHSPQLYVSKGEAHFNLKQYKEALAAYDEAIRLAPESSKAYRGRGKTFEQLAQHSYDEFKRRAQQSYEKAKELGVE
jgi:serine/threonine protein kinase